MLSFGDSHVIECKCLLGQWLAGLYGVIAGFHEMGGRTLRTPMAIREVADGKIDVTTE